MTYQNKNEEYYADLLQDIMVAVMTYRATCSVNAFYECMSLMKRADDIARKIDTTQPGRTAQIRRDLGIPEDMGL